MKDEQTEHVAAALRVARATAAPIPSFAGSADTRSIADGRRVQQLNALHRERGGARRIGRKIGLTSAAVQSQLGVTEPDAGWLWSDTSFHSGATVKRQGLISPRVEAEIALILAADINQADSDMAAVAAAVGSVAPAIEIVDCAIAGWAITLFDFVADNACGWGVVLGAASSLEALDLAAIPMQLERNGVLASEGRGAATMGGPMVALAWLARHAIASGEPLRAGEVVLTGALGPVLPAAAGDRFAATLGKLGTVTVDFD